MSIIFSGQVKNNIKKHENKLTSRELEITKDYYGLGAEGRHTLEELGTKHKITKERVRQIKFVALSKLGLNPKSDEKNKRYKK